MVAARRLLEETSPWDSGSFADAAVVAAAAGGDDAAVPPGDGPASPPASV